MVMKGNWSFEALKDKKREKKKKGLEQKNKKVLFWSQLFMQKQKSRVATQPTTKKPYSASFVWLLPYFF